MAVFWLAASAAWANGVIGMKYAANPETWIFGSVNSICQQTDHKTYVNTVVNSCKVNFHGTFAEANVSIVSKKIFLEELNTLDFSDRVIVIVPSQIR